MALEDFLQVIGKVRERAEKFRSELQKSEALTRYTLIDPVLRALGWDTEDPTHVRPEFSTDSGTPDYALLWEGEAKIMLEAKALGKKLEGAQDKAFQYAWQNGVPYYVATDGIRWELYDVRELNPQKRRLFALEITRVDEGQAARTLLALWRPAMPSVDVPVSPILGVPIFQATPTPGSNQGVPPSPKPPAATSGVSLAQVRENIGKGKFPKGSPPPIAVVFPDGQKRAVRSWKDVLLVVVDWCQPQLATAVPVTKPRSQRALVAISPTGMVTPKAVGPYWVETHFSARSIVKVAFRILSLLGVDPQSITLVYG